jgi:squalene-hopene/tetraprenyl-beta-curcumene cyclase
MLKKTSEATIVPTAGGATSEIDGATLAQVIDEVRESFRAEQRSGGYWLYDLEADVTISAEYIMLLHYLDERNPPLEGKIAKYIRAIQHDDGGWPLFWSGPADISATVKGYFALKLAGDDPDAPHMKRARDLVLAMGGAAKSNVFTRTTLALFGQVPWRAVPTMPVEIMLLPKWFPFHPDKVSYWSRTVIVPLLIVMAKRQPAKNPTKVDIGELFVTPPEAERAYFRDTNGVLGHLFRGVDKVLKTTEPIFPRKLREKSIRRALEWILPRLNGEDGLGGIFPAMANSLMALDALGYSREDPTRRMIKRSIDLLLSDEKEGGEHYCQPCLSPIWDTCLGGLAMLEAGEPGDSATMDKAFCWLLEREILDVVGDWAVRRPGVKPGGWAFQFRNDYYPDVDDTAVIGMLLHRADSERYGEAIKRAAHWIEGMQSKNGGWGAFDADNEYYYLNYIPFADHGALLDPPEIDVTGRCVSFLSQIGHSRDHPAIRKGIEFIKRDQEPDGSWYGRWGTNYIYGTWSALCALNSVGEDMQSPVVRRAVDWLKSKQRPDGGWGETGDTYYFDERRTAGFEKRSTPSQTAWALLALMAAGEIESEAVERGVAFLLNHPRDGAKWREEDYTAVGFPRVFYLRYHGYSVYFPLWALARYRGLVQSNTKNPAWGM